jgi:hypothetical protein
MRRNNLNFVAKKDRDSATSGACSVPKNKNEFQSRITSFYSGEKRMYVQGLQYVFTVTCSRNSNGILKTSDQVVKRCVSIIPLRPACWMRNRKYNFIERDLLNFELNARKKKCSPRHRRRMLFHETFFIRRCSVGYLIKL